jgi:hypothetical protein
MHIVIKVFKVLLYYYILIKMLIHNCQKAVDNAYIEGYYDGYNKGILTGICTGTMLSVILFVMITSK